MELQTLDSAIKYSKKATLCFSARERGMLLKTALEMAGDKWIVKFLPKRFDRYYMRQAPFNHRVRDLSFRQLIMKARFQGQKAPYNFSRLKPLVMSGTFRKVSARSASTKATAAGGNAKAVIKLPVGHAVHKKVTQLAKGMTQKEIHFISDNFKRGVTRMINSSSIKKTKRGKVRVKRTEGGNIELRSLTGMRSRIRR